MEHAVYLCTWSCSANGFAAWVKSRPQLRGQGPTYAEAEEHLLASIQRSGGAMQAVLEFAPPLPKSTWEEKYSTPQLYLIGGDDRFQTNAPRWAWSETATEIDARLRWHDAFYRAPVCRTCRFVAARRSDEPLTLAFAPGRYDGAFGHVGSDGGPCHQIVSDGFLALLSPAERQTLEFRPVIRKGRKKFYELVGPEGPPFVAVAGIKVNGWRCPQCGYARWVYQLEGTAVQSFVARPDLPPSLRGVFTVGTFPEIELTVTADRWRELVGRKGTRGFVTRPLGVVPAHEVVRQPVLPAYEARSRDMIRAMLDRALPAS